LGEKRKERERDGHLFLSREKEKQTTEGREIEKGKKRTTDVSLFGGGEEREGGKTS